MWYTDVCISAFFSVFVSCICLLLDPISVMWFAKSTHQTHFSLNHIDILPSKRAFLRILWLNALNFVLKRYSLCFFWGERGEIAQLLIIIKYRICVRVFVVDRYVCNIHCDFFVAPSSSISA